MQWWKTHQQVFDISFIVVNFVIFERNEGKRAYFVE
jgi:hypothetical protein